jgi:hypothetical protein
MLCSVNKWILLLFVLNFQCLVANIHTIPKVYFNFKPNSFGVVNNSLCTPLVISNSDFKLVEIAATLFCDDVKRVTGLKPALLREIPKNDKTIILAGTLGSNVLIDSLICSQKIDVNSIRHKWESFLITTIEKPFKGVDRALVLIGSDKRATAYALLSLSRAMGVSPWYWWADVVPKHQKRLFIQGGCFIQPSPSVKYRGIFINDERFGGLAHWAARTFDPHTANIGPKTYQKVFELMLRLKANYLWPAMHPGTRAFNSFPENAALANDYGIVMGSSHCEIMLRNNEEEWKAVGTYGVFDYGKNRQTMVDYWEERVKQNGKYENTYTLGLRGIHDYAMAGAETIDKQLAFTQDALSDQRKLLQKHVCQHLEKVPQVLCTYKEVLGIYKAGLKVPDDVTLLWADDNHGFIRNLSDSNEQKRSGRSGVYYHLSYHGDPDSWVWLSSLSPVLMAYELRKAYQHGADRIWVFNVGDIKPAEKEIDFAMEMAWNVSKWKTENATNYIEYWFSEIFGKKYASKMAYIYNEYYQLASSGKEQHIRLIDFSTSEIHARLLAYQKILKIADDLFLKIPN